METRSGLRKIRKLIEIENITAIKELVKERPEVVHRVDVYGLSSIHYAAQHGSLSTFDLLLGNDAFLNAQIQKPSFEFPKVAPERSTQVGQTALHIASGRGDLVVVNYLLNRKIDITKRDMNGLTALLLAVKLGQLGVIQCLVDGGAELQALDKRGLSALHIASIYNHQDVLDYLLTSSQLGINIGDYYGNTPLHYGVLYEYPQIVDSLLSRPEIDVNAGNFNRRTPLHLAVAHGQTPLHMAVQAGDVKAVKELIQRVDADIYISDFSGKSSLEVWKSTFVATSTKTWVEINEAFWDRYTQNSQATSFAKLWLEEYSRLGGPIDYVQREEMNWLGSQIKRTLEHILSSFDFKYDYNLVQCLAGDDDSRDQRRKVPIAKCFSNPKHADERFPSLAPLPLELLEEIFAYVLSEKPTEFPRTFLRKLDKIAFVTSVGYCLKTSCEALRDRQQECPTLLLQLPTPARVDILSATGYESWELGYGIGVEEIELSNRVSVNRNLDWISRRLHQFFPVDSHDSDEEREWETEGLNASESLLPAIDMEDEEEVELDHESLEKLCTWITKTSQEVDNFTYYANILETILP